MSNQFEQHDDEMDAPPEAPPVMMHRPDCRLYSEEFMTGIPKEFVVECFTVDSNGKWDIPLCPVCWSVTHTPVASRICGHEACEICWTKWWEQNAKDDGHNKIAKCLVCRESLHLADIERVSASTRLRMMREIQVRCPNEGCMMKGNIFNVDNHRSFFCRKRLMFCPNFYCGQRMPWDELAQHFRDCAKTEVQSTCPKACHIFKREEE